MESNMTKEVVLSYFAGTCTAFQKKLIGAWLQEDGSSEEFFKWLYEWEKMNIQYQVNVEAGIERHRSWVKSLSEEVTDKPIARQAPVGPVRIRWLLAAASFLLVSLFAGWLAKDRILYQTHQTAFGEIQQIILSDGSKVVLHPNSVFRVPRFGFGNNTREVFLTGEASFEVVHTQNDTRFLVYTGKNISIEVLGTEFNVYYRSLHSRIVLNRGKIQLNYPRGNKMEKRMMRPGELATMDSEGKVVIAQTARPQNFSVWKYHRFVFEDLAFRQICDRLEETFGNRIIIEDQELSKQIISGSFTALSADELLEILREAGDFHTRSNGRQIIISSNDLVEPGSDKN